MNLQQWALVIASATVLLFVLGMVILTIRQADREQDEIERQRERDFEQHRRML